MPQPIVLPNAPYAPDQPGFPSQGAANVRNVYPRTSVSWGAIQTPMPVSSALNSQCLGLASFLGADGTANMFAGDATHLYHLSSASYVWTDVSKAGGSSSLGGIVVVDDAGVVLTDDAGAVVTSDAVVTVTTPGGYNVPSPLLWEFTFFNNQVLATDYADPIQVFNPGGGGLFSDLAAAAPKAKHIAVIKNSFVMVANTQDGANGVLPQRCWWCAAGDASNWPTPGGQIAAQFQAGATDLLGEHGPINALRTELTAADGLVFQQDSLKRIVYVGPPAVFDFLPTQNSRGTYSPYSPVVLGGTVYFLGYDGFYSSDGASVVPIGNDRVNRAFLDDLIPSYYSNVFGAVDPIRQMIWWAYPGQGSVGGVPNHIIGFSWTLDKWSILDITCEAIGRVFGTGYTLDQLYTVLGYQIDNLPAPLDSPLWQGGTQLLAIFDNNHKMNFFTGSAMAPLIETQELEPFPGRRTLITGVRPLIDGTNMQTPQVAIKHREVAEAMPTVTPYSNINALGKAPIRTSGRYVRASITIPAGGDWKNISGAEIDAVPQGTR
jgi:hypothetical protein